MIIGIITLVLLIFLSAFFSGTESAFVSLSEIDLIEISKSRKKNRKTLIKLIENKERLLSTILIGNNVVNIAATSLNTILALQYAHLLGISEELSVMLSATGLAFTILLFGEIAPKSIAITHNRSISLFISPIIAFLSVLLTPILYFFDGISKAINSMLTGKTHRDFAISEKTVINIVARGQEMGVINESEEELIKNVFIFDEREVYPVMTPRTAVFGLEETLTLGEAQESMLEKQFTRVPIYAGSIDNITGIVNLKNVFKHLLDNRHDMQLRELSQKPLYIYETLSLTSLLEQFKSEQNHMAIVVDEFGGMAGIVTLEDILEELVGEIYDEKDVMTSSIRQSGENSWVINGKTDIVTINKNISGQIIIDGEFETLQGLIMSNLDRLPVVGDTLKIKPHQFTVKTMKRNEIMSVFVEYTCSDEPLVDDDD
ncbi:MAG: HlyC/CorC family transporter [Deltaproteobacteria bacterium]|nr:HlyC/CorC family transporter [Deltaproteobacteria bacterium]MBT4264411.1 HlyC/CorC family transporter [Deltaproteobacteria bacterium]MBT4643074.1 HlyC/CorC family transporter [Deltaproteobacteria bacterium]MBT6501751.1 HlyC/CorC family transporter [Deltaproteobacteria bacterium]MBT6610800.1 HlyC/CorC family transporter [Deltaproteobacteria bacterium]